MTKLTPIQNEHLQTAQQRAERLAVVLRREAGSLRALRDFPDELIMGREYPQRLRRGIDRGAARLELTAQGLEAAARGIAAIRAASPPPAFRMPAVPDLGGPVRRHPKAVVVTLPGARVHIASFPGRVDDATRHRGTITSIKAELEAAGPQKGAGIVESILTDCTAMLINFERYLAYLHDHATRMAKAIAASQTPDHKHFPFPPLKMKVRNPRPGKGGGVRPTSGGVKGVAPGPWPGNGASQQAIACWLARSASRAGLPPELPVVCALVESGLRNVDHGDRDSIGLFQIRVGIHPVPPGFGSMSGKHASAAWWNAHPEAQMAWFAAEAKRYRPAGVTDTADGVSRWAVATERPADQYAHRYRDRYAEAAKLVSACERGGASNPAPPTTTRPGKLPVNQLALQQAIGQLGVHEQGGNNRGPKVSEYLRGAGFSTPQPWCAAFVKWCFAKAGFRWPSGNWAWCGTYHAEAKKPNGAMFYVSHDDAKPGDLILFGKDHIAIVEAVHGGQITYVGGNQSGGPGGTDAVNRKVISQSGSFSIIRPRVQH